MNLTGFCLCFCFASQTVLDDSNTTFPDPIQSDISLDNKCISETDAEDVLLNLNIRKACGPVTPIYKNGNAYEVKKKNNYRPISLLNKLI